MERLDLSERRFTQADVLNILPRLSSKTLQNWKARGVIDNDGVSDNPGRGNHRLYTGHGIIMLNFMSMAVDFGIQAANARKMADKAALCADQLWNLKLDELRPNGMRQLTPPAAVENDVYRRGFIFRYNTGYSISIGRKDRNGSISQRFYFVVAIDLINIEALNQINRFIAELPRIPFHVDDILHSDEADDPNIIDKHEMILASIRKLPVDRYDDYA